ncbi:enoyl-CoA hydratase/isomerase family protein [Parapusillimonas granuli]|uniref:Enoyl-CoA hydratase/isomerase family protein n=1 Tax=Parapusillimonas granuli TaxID=380911 RepID=A0A853FYK3_9BURK|nr:enoyl-CoA hydratase-related protein [Parapusillimonas granuli]MBB5214432.1 enoyl-CoA hydratase/carnithine racemase [Parapusillimonas granuli]NYT49159.1 enoyl-CoA hydratase/isomerase family protein [Parapusillimonas granuli]
MSVHKTLSGHVATLTIDRPAALNALDLPTLRRLRQHLMEARDNREIRVVVIAGGGDRAFCVGADLKGTTTSPAPYAEAYFQAKEIAADMGLYVRLMDLSDLDLNKPLIAAINGHCLGGGLELALQCDLRIASHNATFGLPEVAVGSVPAVSGLHRLLRAVPSAAAMQLALTGNRIQAEQALQWGLISEMVPQEKLATRIADIAGQIAANAPLAVQAVKKLAAQTAHLSYADAQQLTELYWGVLRDTDDRREGRRAFAEKRSPRFAGR